MRKDELVKAAILQAAETLFQRWGIAKTTMEDIAHATGKGKSTLYYYFKSKDEVLEAVAMAQMARIAGIAREAIAQMETAKEKLIAYFFSTFKEMRRTSALYDIARGEIRADKRLIDGVMRKLDDLDEKAIESILRVGIERGEFKGIGLRELKTTARAIITVKKSLTIALFIDNRDRQLIDSIIRLLSEAL